MSTAFKMALGVPGAAPPPQAGVMKVIVPPDAAAQRRDRSDARCSRGGCGDIDWSGHNGAFDEGFQLLDVSRHLKCIFQSMGLAAPVSRSGRGESLREREQRGRRGARARVRAGRLPLLRGWSPAWPEGPVFAASLAKLGAPKEPTDLHSRSKFLRAKKQIREPGST